MYVVVVNANITIVPTEDWISSSGKTNLMSVNVDDNTINWVINYSCDNEIHGNYTFAQITVK